MVFCVWFVPLTTEFETFFVGAEEEEEEEEEEEAKGCASDYLFVMKQMFDRPCNCTVTSARSEFVSLDATPTRRPLF